MGILDGVSPGLVAQLAEAELDGIRFRLVDGKLRVSGPKEALARWQQLIGCYAHQIKFLLQNQGEQQNNYRPYKPVLGSYWQKWTYFGSK